MEIFSNTRQFFDKDSETKALNGKILQTTERVKTFTKGGRPSKIETNLQTISQSQSVDKRSIKGGNLANDNSMIILNMCDFCSHERSDCGANPVLAETLEIEIHDPNQLNAVIACDKYKSPVDVLKERFHDPNL